jgi:glucan-binding YG repeat protein
MAVGWTQISGTWYYFEVNGKMVSNGWVGDYYLKYGGQMARNEWVDNDKYYVDQNGKWVKDKAKDDETGWENDGTGKKYKNTDGTYSQNIWQQIGGYWYRFDSNGHVIVGWKQVGSYWYYFEADGKMAHDKWVGNYYVNSDGQMVCKEWIKGKYYVGESGAYVKNAWQKIDGYWYWFDASGSAVVGWRQIGSDWYYFETDGKMAASKWVGDYYMKSGGQMAQNEWVGAYYMKSGGLMAKDEWVDNGKYYVDSRGIYVKNIWKQIGGYWYYFEANGRVAVGWKHIGSDDYYFGEDGKMATDQWIEDKYVDSSGKWDKDKVKDEDTDKFIINNVTYSIISGTSNVSVTAYNGSDSTVDIPTNPTYGANTYTVTEIGEEAFMGNTSLTSISLPNTVTVIHARAFKDCSNLANMTTHD